MEGLYLGFGGRRSRRVRILEALSVVPRCHVADERCMRAASAADFKQEADRLSRLLIPNAVMQYAVRDMEGLSIDQAALARRRDRLTATLINAGCEVLPPEGTLNLWSKWSEGDAERVWNRPRRSRRVRPAGATGRAATVPVPSQGRRASHSFSPHGVSPCSAPGGIRMIFGCPGRTVLDHVPPEAYHTGDPCSRQTSP
jgi:hypothetical protein